MGGSSAAGDAAVVDRVRRALLASEPAHRGVADAEVVWVGRNGSRIDLRLRDGAGREHHVVATAEGDEVAVGLVLTEPDDVARAEPVAVVVNGPSGSGKSSLLQAIAARDETRWVVFDEPVIGTTDQRLLAPRVGAGSTGRVPPTPPLGRGPSATSGPVR